VRRTFADAIIRTGTLRVVNSLCLSSPQKGVEHLDVFGCFFVVTVEGVRNVLGEVVRDVVQVTVAVRDALNRDRTLIFVVGFVVVSEPASRRTVSEVCIYQRTESVFADRTANEDSEVSVYVTALVGFVNPTELVVSTFEGAM
jgi:hypothetical protein